MAEYIERGDAFDAVMGQFCASSDETEEALNGAIEDICKIPAADVVPVRHGRWIWDKDGMDWGIGAWRCSECKVMSPMWWNADETNPRTKSGHRFCPNCGARMDGDA